VLNFSRNNTIDIEDPATLVSAQRLLTQNYEDHCIDAHKAALICGGDVRLQALAATTRASGFTTQIEASSADLQIRADFLRKRATREPHTGKCDAILVTPVSADLDGDHDTAKFLDNFSLVLGVKSTKSKSKSKSQKKSETQSTVSSPSDSLLSPPATSARRTSPSPSGQTKVIDPLDPFHISSTESRSASVLEESDDSNSFVINWTDLLLPALVVENKKMNDTKTKALNQGRMYSVSAVTFLASLGITGYPVYCLVTSGKIGGVLVTWQATKGKVRA
jgi:hypothetical protein